MIVIEWLALMVFQKQGLAQTLQQGLFIDIRTGIMDEYTRLHISRCVDMAVPLSSGDTALRKFAIILEINDKSFLAILQASDLTDFVFHIYPLLRRQQQICGGIHAHRHVMEVPRKDTALLNEHIQKFIAGHIQIVLAGIANEHAKGNFIGVHQLHGMDRLVKMARSSSAVIGLLEVLNAHGHKEITHSEQLPAERIVNEYAICKA